MEEISSHFRALLNRGNAARIQQFDIIFEQDLSPAFQNIFPIENRIIFVVIYMASTCCAHSASQGKTVQAADPPQWQSRGRHIERSQR